MPAHEALLGFDARALPESPHPLPRQFLLRDGLETVLTVDRMIWPTVVSHSDRPQWVGANDPLWESLDRLEHAVAGRACFVIAATWHAEHSFAEETRGLIGPHLEPTDPTQRHPNWQFLGYDITDGGSISGLSNCGYTAEEQPQLENQFGPLLNRHHLFEDLQQAFVFRDITNRRVPEHAPFFVIGLWRVPKP